MNEPLRRLTMAAYLVAVLFVLFPVADVATNVWPWVPWSEQWRFAAVGVLSNYVVSVVFGFLLAAVVAAAAGHARVLRALSMMTGLGTAVLAVGCLGFILDTLQVRGTVRDDQVEYFRIGAMKTFGKMAGSTAAVLVLTLGVIRAARTAWDGAEGGRKKATPLPDD